MGALEYHLRELETAGLITCHQGLHKRYFPKETQPADRPLLGLLRQELPRRILVLVLRTGAATKSEFVEALNAPASTLNYHLRHLTDRTVLDVERDGREAVYRVRDPETVRRLLVAYRSTLLDRMVDAFLETTGALR